ncbi:MAG: ChaN family lipoprotein [Acetobacterales bacterium]
MGPPLPLLACALVALALGACATAPGVPEAPSAPFSPVVALPAGASGIHPLNGRIWAPAEQRFLEPEQAVARADKARFVLLGETHDNPDHHRLQASFIRSIALTGRRPAVVWEMIPADKGLAVAGYWGLPGHDADGLGDILDWDESGWPEWSMYQPVARAALVARLPIAPGDLSGEARRLVARGGIPALGRVRAAELQLDEPLPDRLRKDLVARLEGSHCGMLRGPAVERMVDVQRARDAALADALVRAAEAGEPGDGAILIAGGGHARKDYGVPWYLRQHGVKEEEMLAVRFVEVAPGDEAASGYVEQGAFDLLWFTTPVDRGDPCEALREHRKK